MAALALCLSAVVKVQACVCACTCMTEGAGGIAGCMIILCILMAQSAVSPVKHHAAEIRRHALVLWTKRVIDRITFPDMTSVAFLICRGIMYAYTASIVRQNLEFRPVVAEFALWFGTI